MTKPTKWLCAQRRLSSAWASAQSDQSLRCTHEEGFGPYLPIERTAKTLISLGIPQRRLIRLGGCPGWSESSLGTHTFSWFWHVVAQVMFTVVGTWPACLIPSHLVWQSFTVTQDCPLLKIGCAVYVSYFLSGNAQSSDTVSKKDCGRMTVNFREFIIPVQSTELGAKRSHAYDKNKTWSAANTKVVYFKCLLSTAHDQLAPSSVDSKGKRDNAGHLPRQ